VELGSGGAARARAVGAAIGRTARGRGRGSAPSEARERRPAPHAAAVPPRAAVLLCAGALLGVALAGVAPFGPAPASAQEPGVEGFQIESSFVWTSLLGGAFPSGETGIGITGQSRYRWPNGLSVGVGGLYAEPEDLDLPSGDRRRTMEQIALFAEGRYHLSRVSPFRPYLGARVGWTELTSENVVAAEGDGIYYGGVIGAEYWPVDRFGIRANGVASGFAIDGFFPDRTTTAAEVGGEIGFTVFLGATRRDADGDGVLDRRDACPDTPGRVRVDATGCATDRDLDGVPDYRDDCPRTPRGASVDRLGCGADADRDGVLDGVDTCPDTPAGAPVDIEGCALDTDGDGVHDGRDECPDTPPGAEVNDRGCRPDADSDGVPDAADACPDSAEGLPVDGEGCSQVQRDLAEGAVTLRDLRLEFEAVTVRGPSARRLDQIGRALLENPAWRVEIRVWTDTLGPEGYNLRMSELLAEGIRDELSRRFPALDPARLLPRGMGEAGPGEEGEAPAGEGRRVEFVIVEGREDGAEGGGDGTWTGEEPGAADPDGGTRGGDRPGT